MQRNQKEEFLKFCRFINGQDVLIGAVVITGAIGLFGYSLVKETMSLGSIVLLELALALIVAALLALYFYSNYNAYRQLISGKKIPVKGGEDFFKSFSSSFWEGESTASVAFRLEVSKTEATEVRKALTDFVDRFVDHANKRFAHRFTVKGWEVNAEVTLGKSSNYFLSELISSLMIIQSKFPTSTISLALNTSGETKIQSTREESSDETWEEARWRHQMERDSHDRDMGGDHPHHH